MSSYPCSLSQLGWRAFYSQQLTLTDYDAGFPARVVSVHRSNLTVLSELAETRVTLPRSTGRDAAPMQATVGDWTLIEHAAPRVLRVLERCTLIERIAAGGLRRQAIAANIDTLFIVSSCNDDFNASRLERYLVLAREARVTPAIVLTKADLCADVDRYLAIARRLAPGVQTIAVDATTAAVRDVLKVWLGAGQAIAFVGSSGVGKSTLVNTLLGVHAQPAAGIREDDAKGRHTTSARQMFALPGGAWVIDTPGMRELRIRSIDAGGKLVFDDIEALATACRFRDCRHDGDVGCAVAGAVESGVLEARRLANYLKLQREAAHASESVRERRERERHFGRMHRSAQRVQRRQKGQDG